LQRLVLEINNKVGIVGILTEAQRGAIDEATHQLSDSGGYVVAFANVSGCMEDLGMFVKYRLFAMDSGHLETLLRLSASAILELVDGITAVVAKQPENRRKRGLYRRGSGCSTHQLFRIPLRDFCVYLQRHREPLDYTFGNEEIETIGRQHKALYDSYHRQPNVKSSIGSFDDSAAYPDAWIGLQNTLYVATEIRRWSGDHLSQYIPCCWLCRPTDQDSNVESKECLAFFRMLVF
jgi:hypothetical protein